MTASSAGAERTRRYRRHKAGDHSLCLPGRPCTEGDAPQLAREPAGQRASDLSADPPAGTGRGARLWTAMQDQDLGPTHLVLLEEACRMADRLDRLDAILDGREDWLRLQVNEDGSEITVTVDKVLAESRQLQTAFKGVVAELRAAKPKASATPAKSEEGGLGELLSLVSSARRGTSAG